MWNWFNNLFGFGIPQAEKWGNDIFLFDPNADFSTFTNDKLKVAAVFCNPAVLKVFKLQCDMFSQGEIYVYRNGKRLDNDPFLNLINNPNPFQQKSQFLWDAMFWAMIGNAYCYVDSNSVTSETNKLYIMDSGKMIFPAEMNAYRDMLVLSSATMDKINNLQITYSRADGSEDKVKWGNITHFPYLSNGTGNWFKGMSCIDALYQIIANSKASPSSKNVTVRYAGKYMVAGKADPENVNQEMMGEDEKTSIERKTNSYKTVTAVKSMIDIKRFVEKGAIISELDASYWDDYFKIGSMFGIPRDVLEASLKGSTYENQEIARGAHVDYTLQPFGDQFMGALGRRFGYTTKSIKMSWDHLPFTNAKAKQKAETDKLNSEALINYMKAGVKLEEINSTLDTNFTELNYETANRASQSGNSSQNSGNSQPAN